MKRNTDYKNDALAALKGNWGKAVLATVIYMAIVYIAMGPYLYQNFKFQAAMTAAGGAMDAEALISQMSTVTGYAGLYGLLTIFLIAPLMVGFINAFRALLVQGDREIPTNMYKIATKGYWHKVWGMFLMSVFIFLWSLLFVIPGIIKAFSYRERGHRPQPRDDEGPQVRPVLALPELHRLGHPLHPHARNRHLLAHPVHADGAGFLLRGREGRL